MTVGELVPAPTINQWVVGVTIVEGDAPPEPPAPNPQITSPTDGETVDPVHHVIGVGAAPDAEVQLWSGDRDPTGANPNATTTADAAGNWGFTGDTPVAAGIDLEWFVITDGVESPHVSVHVADEPEPKAKSEPAEELEG